MPHFDETAAGVYIIAVTPFDDGGRLDLDSTDRLVDFYLDKGVTGITVLGMMGEAPKLTAEESNTFVRHVLKRINGAIPTIVGVSAPGYASMGELARTVMDAGAAGVMIAPPSTVRTDDQIVAYFEGAAEAIGLETPFVLQDFPLASNVVISPSTILRIVRSLHSCVMLKHEDWPGLSKITALRQASDKGERRISILTGNGGIFLPEEMGRGADGAMTGFAFPEMLVDVCKLMAAGETTKAFDLFDAHLPLVRYEQQPGFGLAVRKYVLQKRGAMKSARVRKPGPQLSSHDIAEIEWMLARQASRLAALG